MINCRLVHILDHLLELSGGCSVVALLLHHKRVVGVSVQTFHFILYVHRITGRGGGVWGVVRVLGGCAAPA